MGTSHQNAKQIVLKLEKKGFISIEKDERDGRAIRLKLTEKSYNFWEKRAEKDDNYITELFKTLTHEETDSMYRAIGKIFGKIQEMGK
jgi:DNA-binding MarR family transcriptional regulator